MIRRFGPLTLIVLILAISIYSAVFTVNQTQQAILTQFGEPMGDPLEPGLHIKVPFIQQVDRIDNRLLDYCPQEFELYSADKQKMLLSCFTKWHVAEPLIFFKRTGDKQTALLKMGDIIEAEFRFEMGKRELGQTVSTGRVPALQEIQQRSNEACQQYGISIVDLQIRNIRLVAGNLDAVFERMRSDFDALSRQYTSEGEERSLKLKAQADLMRATIIAEAQQMAQVIRGKAEAEATRIYGEAYQQDPEFFNFIRTLEASRKSLDKDSLLILTPEYDFLKFFKASKVEFSNR